MYKIIVWLIVTSLFTLAITVWAQVGLEALEQIENLPYLKLETQAHQHASYGGCRRPLYIDSNGEHVLSDIEGPGCVYNFWFTSEENPPVSTGNLKIYIDGETTPRSDMPIEDYFTGENYPFVESLVVGRFNRDKRDGGYSFFVPISFKESFKMTVNDAIAGPMFYHVLYHTFTTDEGVESWTGTEDVSTVVDMWNNCGKDPKDISTNLIVSGNSSISRGQTHKIVDITGGGSINSIKIFPTPSDRIIMEDCKIRCYWDGESVPSIDIPIGAFFGCIGEYKKFKSLMIGMQENEFYCYFPMPYWESAIIEIYNGSTEEITNLDYEVQYITTPYHQGKAGYFSAIFNRENPTTTRKNYTVLNTVGMGHYVGIVYSVTEVEDPVPPDEYWWGEGDEICYIDDKKSPSIWGTGSEDYFLRGWGFTRGNFPLFGVHGSKYRIHIGDCIPFESNINFGMEHGEYNNTNGKFSSIAYYYILDEQNLVLTDSIDIGDISSETIHNYQINGKVWSGSLTSKYEGEDDTIIFEITDDGHSFNNYSEFTVSINPFNKGIRLRRRIDQDNSRQKAKVYVDGTYAGIWYTSDYTYSVPYSMEDRRWRDIDFEISPAYTAGRDEISLKIEYVSSSSDKINEFYYWVYSYNTGKEIDLVPPNPPQNLTSPYQSETSITLNWEQPDPASDGDIAASYIVKRNGETIGTATNTKYEDLGLIENTLYNYAIYSVDDAGNQSETAVTGSFNTITDTTPPVMSNVQSSNISATSVLISWTTNEPATSQVQYGTSTDYGFSTSFPNIVTKHSVSLIGLTPATVYHYMVGGKDASENHAVSQDFIFTTREESSILSFGIHTSCMQIMPGDNNSPEKQGNKGNVDEIISLHKEMGFKWDRCNIAWGSVEYPKGVYHWEVIDERLNKIFEAGIQVSVIIYGGNNYDGTIYWDKKVPGFDGLAGTRQEYKDFVEKCVERYDGDGIDDGPVNGIIKYWEGWNEPTNFAGITVEQATELFNDYYEACKNADPDCKIISPGFAWTDLFEDFIPNAVGFDMLSVHDNYWDSEELDPDEGMFEGIQTQDSYFKNWDLGSRSWWISEFGPDGSCDGDHHEYSFRTIKLYVVSRYFMFHNNLIASGNFYCEGMKIAVINRNDWTLKPCGVATKVYLSILQDPEIIQSERITGNNYRIYKFTTSSGLSKYALWAMEESGNTPIVKVNVNSTIVIKTDLYGENKETLNVSDGTVSVRLYPEVIYLEEISDDTTPPNPPKNLTSLNQTESSITLAWGPPDPASDGDRADSYKIYREGNLIGTTTNTIYESLGLTESISYNYAVYSVDDANNTSAQAATGTFITKGDTTPPDVASVSATGSNTVRVAYDEKVEQSSSENPSNYSINNGITVQGATLQFDETTVILTTTDLQVGISYQLTITGVKDQSQAQNEITIPIVKSFAYVAELEISNITVATGRDYVSSYIDEGDEYYIDRTVTVTDIPTDYEGLLWLKTANDDKQQNSPSDFLRYDVNQDVIVYVGYDPRLALPGWLSGWADSGEVIKSSAEEDKNIYRLYSREFSRGTVTLGANAASTSSSNMYIVLNKASGSQPDRTPPDPPTGVKVSTVGGNK